MARSAQARGDDYRARLLAGTAAAIAEVGYPAFSIADVVRHARVSRRTFYEHFAGKAECLLALYAAESDALVAEIEAALREVPDGEARLRAGVAVYLAGLQARPGLARTLLVEILAAGPRGLAVRRAAHRRFAGLFLRPMEAAGAGTELSAALATALVGGVNELVLEAVEEGRAARLTALAPAVMALVRSVLAPQVERGAGAGAPRGSS